MALTAKRQPPNLITRWILIIGLFLLVQGLFVLINSTGWQPNINDSGSLLPRIMRGILASALFQEWIAPYALPSLNIFTAVHVMAIFIQAIRDMISRMKPNTE